MASHQDLMRMDEEEILKRIKNEGHGIETEVGVAYLEHRFYRRLLGQNRWLVWATWVLAVMAIVSMIISNSRG